MSLRKLDQELDHHLADFGEVSKGNAMGSAKVKGKSVDELDDDELPGIWGGLQGAIWLIGIAILAWQGWWWPGILVLVAISGITAALARERLKKEEETVRVAAEEKVLHNTRAAALPERCNACGAPLSAKSVIWHSATTASCPYCDTAVKAGTV